MEVGLIAVSDVYPERGDKLVHFSFDVEGVNLDVQRLDEGITHVSQVERQRFVIGRRQFQVTNLTTFIRLRAWNTMSVSADVANKMIEFLRSQKFVSEAGNPQLIAAYNSNHPFNFASVLKQSRKNGYLAYLESDHWKATRKAALERAGHRCQVCATTTQLEVHHNSYENLWNEKPEDLVVLCRKHHQLFHDAS